MSNREPIPADASFSTTRWSVILLAQNEAHPGSHEAMEGFCRAYLYPLYAFLRRLGCPPTDAQDVVQDFFSQILERRTLARIKPEGGRFRSFMMTGVKNVWLQSLEKARAIKRGGGALTISLCAMDPEARYAAEPNEPGESPERVCDRHWAEALIEQVISRLAAEYAAEGRRERFECLRPFLQMSGDLTGTAEIAQQLGLTEAGVKSAILRLRQRQAILFREEVERTVSSPEEAEAEIRYLISVLAT